MRDTSGEIIAQSPETLPHANLIRADRQVVAGVRIAVFILRVDVGKDVIVSRGDV